jgi:hypothetical protein
MEFPKFCPSYMANDGQLPSLERFRAKWTPVRVKKTRQNKRLDPVLISIGKGLQYAGAYDASVMGRKRTLRVRKRHLLAGADRDMPPPGEVDGEYPK